MKPKQPLPPLPDLDGVTYAPRTVSSTINHWMPPPGTPAPPESAPLRAQRRQYNRQSQINAVRVNLSEVEEGVRWVLRVSSLYPLRKDQPAIALIRVPIPHKSRAPGVRWEIYVGEDLLARTTSRSAAISEAVWYMTKKKANVDYWFNTNLIEPPRRKPLNPRLERNIAEGRIALPGSSQAYRGGNGVPIKHILDGHRRPAAQATAVWPDLEI